MAKRVPLIDQGVWKDTLNSLLGQPETWWRVVMTFPRNAEGMVAKMRRGATTGKARSAAASAKKARTEAKRTPEVRDTIKRTRKWGLAAVVKELREKHGVRVGRDTAKRWRGPLSRSGN